MDAFPPGFFDNTASAFRHRSDAELRKARWLFGLMSVQPLVEFGASATEIGMKMGLPLSPLFRYTIYEHFCGGETFEECKKTVEAIGRHGVLSMLNYGVEFQESDEEFDRALQHNLEALTFAGRNHLVEVLCVKPTGYGRFELYEKVQRGLSLTPNETAEYERVKQRFDTLCRLASENGVAVYFDAEESWIQDALDALVEEMMQRYNRQGRAVVFNTIQLYRHDRLKYLNDQIGKARSGGYLLGAKLVRGAYMEKERERAVAMGYPSPIHTDKAAVDRDFDDAVSACLHQLDVVSVCIASQSEVSNLKAINLMEELKLPRNHRHVLFSQLLGMGENITFNLAEAGFRSCKYIPFGPVRKVIPYLIRRSQENTSVAGQTTRELNLIKAEIERRRKQR